MATSPSLKGSVTRIMELQTGASKAGKEWKKQEFAIETNEQYPKTVAFTVFGDKISLMDGLKEGQEIEVFFNLESREYNGKFFHNINAWKIDVASGQAKQAPTTNVTDHSGGSNMPAYTPTATEDEGNDLPF